MTGPEEDRADGPEPAPPSFPPAARRSAWPASDEAEAGRDGGAGDHDVVTDGPESRDTDLAPGDQDSPDPARAHHLAEPTRRRRGPTVAIVLLSVGLVAALAGGGYLAVLAHQWNERSGEWEAQSRDLGQRVADLTTDLEGMTSDLTSTRDQLTTAQQRITELADEKAQVGDDRETQRIAASDIQAVAEAAVDVSSKMGDCVTAQSSLLGFVAAPDSTTPEGLQQATDDTNAICKLAVDSYASLQRDLSRP